MVTDNLDDLLHIDVPMFATMAVISVMMSNREQRQALPREPYKEVCEWILFFMFSFLMLIFDMINEFDSIK